MIWDADAGGLSLRYRFDAAGNLTSLQQATQNTTLARYGYDGLNRLTQVMDGPTGTPIETYAYDATGNRTALTNAGNTTAYSYPSDSHRLSRVGGISRTYDAAGNTTTIGGNARQFGYDASGRMTQAKADNTVLRQYQYNAKGEQTRAYLDADSTYFVHDEAGHLLGEYDVNGAPKQQILWFGDLPVGVLQGSGASQQLHYIEPDHLGTPRVIIDGQRNVAIWEWKLTGEAFGATPPNQDPDGDGVNFAFDLRFPGQRYDAATGLNYNMRRDYDSGTGRFPESYPAGLLGGLSTYGYAFSNPLTWIDPDGMQAKPAPAPAPPSSPPRFTPPNMPPANDPAYGPRSPWGPAGVVLRLCASPQAALFVVLMAIPNSTSSCDTLDKPPQCEQGGDDDNTCDYQYYKVDTPVCNAIARKRGAMAGRACHASAAERYSACLAGRPMPPLNTWNN